MFYHVLLMTKCSRCFCGHHQSSIVTVLRKQQTVKLCTCSHSTLYWIPQISNMITQCQLIYC